MSWVQGFKGASQFKPDRLDRFGPHETRQLVFSDRRGETGCARGLRGPAQPEHSDSTSTASVLKETPCQPSQTQASTSCSTMIAGARRQLISRAAGVRCSTASTGPLTLTHRASGSAGSALQQHAHQTEWICRRRRMGLLVQETLPLQNNSRQRGHHFSTVTAASIDAKIPELSSLPFKRSVTPDGRPRRARKLDVRSEAKLDALEDAKQHVERLRADVLSATENRSESEDTERLREKLSVAEEALSVAYSQAIKYTSRQSQDAHAVQTATSLINEWTGRIFGGDVRSNHKGLNRKKMTRRVHEILRSLNGNDCTNEQAATASDDGRRSAMSPPFRRDYINILRAHSTSKALRKGEQGEALIDSMMDVAVYSAHRFAESEDENEREKWKRIVVDSLPDSKVFALAIKCYAGSTRKYFGHASRVFWLNSMPLS